MTTIKYKQITSEFFGFVDNTTDDTAFLGEYYAYTSGFPKRTYNGSDVVADTSLAYWAERIPVFVCPQNKVCKIKLMATGGTAYWRGNGGVDTGTVKDFNNQTSLKTYHHVYAGYNNKLKLGGWNDTNTAISYGKSENQIEVFVAPGDQIFWHPGEDTSGRPLLGTLTIVIFEEDAGPAPRENKVAYNTELNSQQRFNAPFGTLD